jgi:hypothetical protein
MPAPQTNSAPLSLLSARYAATSASCAAAIAARDTGTPVESTNASLPRSALACARSIDISPA